MDDESLGGEYFSGNEEEQEDSPEEQETSKSDGGEEGRQQQEAVEPSQRTLTGQQDGSECECRRLYVGEGGNSKKILYLLAIGLSDPDDASRQLFSFDDPPWCTLPKTSMRPRNADYLNEINRRAYRYNILPRPRAKNWQRPRIMEWLQAHPVCEVQCIAFLVAEVKKLRDVLNRMNEQALESMPTGMGKWRGSIPYLRVIMCLTDDNVKNLYLNRANVRTRQEIDGRNSENRYVGSVVLVHSLTCAFLTQSSSCEQA